MLLAIDATRLLVLFVLHVGTFGASHDSIRFGPTLDTVEVNLASGQSLRLAHRQFAALHAVHDALALVVLAGVVARGVRIGRTHHHETSGQTQTGQHIRLLHDFLSSGPTHDEFGPVEINNGPHPVALTPQASYHPPP